MTQVDTLRKHWGIVTTQWSDVYDHLGTFVGTAKELHAQKVIELGVRYGVSTIAWITAMHLTGGHLWAVDGAPPVIEPTMQVDLLNPLMGMSEWEFVLGWDDDPAVLAQMPTDADIVFIDTNHTYELTMAELTEYVPRVRSGGRMFLHDTDLYETANASGPQPPYPVRTAMEEFCEERGLRCENNPACNGLGTIFVS